jgi:uncharacterized protein
MQDFKLSFYTVITDILDEDATKPQRILYATRTGRAVVLYDEVLENIKSGNYDQIPNKVLFELISIEAIVPANENELESIIENNQAAIDDNRVLGFTIQPGASCQLGCGYCGQKHSKDYMTSDLYTKMIERIKGKIHNKPYNHLDIMWYGGEPLMALKQIRELTPELLSLTKENGMGYSAGMVTNALSLKEDIFYELVTSLNVKSFQITIDGTAEFHDQRRYTKEGSKPTFDIIFNNILKITSRADFEQLGARISIRCNADKNNIEGIIPFIHLLAEHNLQKKIQFYIAPIHDWGDNNAEKELGVAKNDFAELEIDWMIELIKLNFGVSLLPARKQTVCMVVDPDAEVYDAFGNVSTCWEIPYTPVFENSEYVIGNLKSAKEIVTEDIPMRNWNSNIREGKTWCKTCNLLPVCGGSCPKHWLEGNPACPTFKFNIQDRLVLHYINKTQDIKELV